MRRKKETGGTTRGLRRRYNECPCTEEWENRVSGKADSRRRAGCLLKEEKPRRSTKRREEEDGKDTHFSPVSAALTLSGDTLRRRKALYSVFSNPSYGEEMWASAIAAPSVHCIVEIPLTLRRPPGYFLILSFLLVVTQFCVKMLCGFWCVFVEKARTFFSLQQHRRPRVAPRAVTPNERGNQPTKEGEKTVEASRKHRFANKKRGQRGARGGKKVTKWTRR